MSKLLVYGVPGTRAFRTLWMAEELGLDYELVRMAFDETGVGSSMYRRINPNLRVPAIKDGDFTLWESLAINLYLAKKHRKLYPATLEDEARAWQWSFWAMSELEAPLLEWALNDHVRAPDKRDPAIAAAALDKLKRPFGVLDPVLSGGKYMLGDAFGVVDVNLASLMYRALKMDLTAFPNIGRWLKACYARPAAIEVRQLREAA